MCLQVLFRYLLIFTFILISGCSSIISRHEKAEYIAQGAGLSKRVVKSGQFLITTYSRFIPANRELLIVYIEGDGFSFDKRQRLSSDPTPKKPIGLQLAARDINHSVLYIARPCQYLTKDQLHYCDPKYWSTHRYSEEIVNSINRVIDEPGNQYNEIALIGYSGGGTIAALIAARRNNIKWLVTIAANLDHKAWTDLHHITPLTGSLNARDFAPVLTNKVQRHFVGGKDRIVPNDVVYSYSNNFNDPQNLEIIIEPDFDHQCCWVNHWPELLCQSGDPFKQFCNQ